MTKTQALEVVKHWSQLVARDYVSDDLLRSCREKRQRF